MARLDAVLRSGLPGEPERLAGLDAAIRAPLPLSTAVGVLSADPDAPTAVVGGLLAGVLAARRPQRVLAVAAHPAERSIAWHAGVAGPATSTAGDAARRASAGSSAEATSGLARSAGGVWALDLDGTPSAWWESVAPISRFFDFVVTDWGEPASLDDPRAASAVLLVVTRAGRDALQAGVDLLARVADPDVPGLLAVHDAGDGPLGLREAARVTGASWIPADPGLRGPVPSLGRELRYATNWAALELAARVVGAAVNRNRAGRQA